MKRLLIAPLMLLSLALAGCAGTPAGNVVSTITRPVEAVDIYRVKNVYAAALTAVVEYRTYCWSKPYAALMADPIARPVCQNRRQYVRTAQSAQIRAGAAIRAAEGNPTLVSAAWSAVTAFQNAIPQRSK